MLTLRECEPVDEIHGNPVKHPAHKADLIRLWALRDHGGVYLDLDAWLLRDPSVFRHCPCVLGLQGASDGLCNAVMIAQQGCEFIRRWIDEYHDFDGDLWDEHSVRRPIELARRWPHLVHVQPESAFFWPHFTDPDEVFLEDVWSTTRQRVKSALAGRGRPDQRLRRALQAVCGDRSVRAVRARRASNEARLRRSFAVHLWEKMWWDRYLSRVTPAWLGESPSLLAARAREVLGADRVAELRELADAER